MMLLTAGGLLTVEQAFSGFGTPAVVAVAAFFVISAGLERTGVATVVSRPIRAMAGRSYRRLLAMLMAVTGLLSGVMNNLAAVSVLLPVTMAIAYRRRISPTRLLLPLAHAARFGGNLTLIAGPSNLVMADILRQRGLATLGLFDFLPLGLPLLLGGTALMVTFADRLLPRRPPVEWLRAARRRSRLVKLYRLNRRLFEVRIPPASPLAGKTVEESEFGRAYGLNIVSVVHQGRQLLSPPKDLRLLAGDRLVIAGRLDELLEAEAFERIGVEMARAEHLSLDSPEMGMVEAILSPRSLLAGRTLKDLLFRDRYGVTVLALWREGRPVRTRLGEIPLLPGDGLLIQGPWKALNVLRGDPDFILLEEDLRAEARGRKTVYALLAVGLMIVLTLAGQHIAVAATIAAGVIVLAGGLTMEEAYRAVDWRSIVLMGGLLPLGVAMETTGAARAVADAVLPLVGQHPLGALAALLLTATAIGQVIPSIATTVLLAPLALDVAAALGTSPLPFAMAIVGATGLTLLTPISNPVMLMVMAPGAYTFRNYVRAGLPIVGVLFLMLLVVIPLAFPF